MKKIPVLATIREAYQFTFTHLGAIIGLIWLPMILLTVIGFFVKRRFLDALAGSLASDSYTSTGPETLGLLCYFIAALLLLAMMCVPVMQLALGTRKQGAMIHFGFSGTEWRLFRSLMGLIGFLLLPLLVIIIAISLVQTSNGAVLRIAQSLPLVMLVYFLGAIYCGLRFGLLLPAVTVSETGPLLSRTWSLTAGNFLRILA